MVKKAVEGREIVPAGAAAAAAAGERQPTQWTNREAAIIASVLGRGLSDDDIRAYAAICRHTGLDPFKREIYAWRDRDQLVVHIGIGGWRAMAARSGEYDGQDPVEYTDGSSCRLCDGKGGVPVSIAAPTAVKPCPICGGDGLHWAPFWDDETGKPPKAARASVYRKGRAAPTRTVVTWKEFERTQARTRAQGPTLWDTKGSWMLGVRAEYHTLKRACPEAWTRMADLVAETRANVQVVDSGAAEEEIPGAEAAAALAGPSEATEPVVDVPDWGPNAVVVDQVQWVKQVEEETTEAGIPVASVLGYLASVGYPSPTEEDPSRHPWEGIGWWLWDDQTRTVRRLVSLTVDWLNEQERARKRGPRGRS